MCRTAANHLGCDSGCINETVAVGGRQCAPPKRLFMVPNSRRASPITASRPEYREPGPRRGGLGGPTLGRLRSSCRVVDASIMENIVRRTPRRRRAAG